MRARNKPNISISIQSPGQWVARRGDAGVPLSVPRDITCARYEAAEKFHANTKKVSKKLTNRRLRVVIPARDDYEYLDRIMEGYRECAEDPRIGFWACLVAINCLCGVSAYECDDGQVEYLLSAHVQYRISDGPGAEVLQRLFYLILPKIRVE